MDAQYLKLDMSRTELLTPSSHPSTQLLPFYLLRPQTVGSHLTLFFLSHCIYNPSSDPLGSFLNIYLEADNFSSTATILAQVTIISHLDYSALFGSSPPSVYSQTGFQSNRFRLLIQIRLVLCSKASKSSNLTQTMWPMRPDMIWAPLSCYYPFPAPVQVLWLPRCSQNVPYTPSAPTLECSLPDTHRATSLSSSDLYSNPSAVKSFLPPANKNSNTPSTYTLSVSPVLFFSSAVLISFYLFIHIISLDAQEWK